MLHAIAYFIGVVSIRKNCNRSKREKNKQKSPFATVHVTRTKALNNNSKIECIMSSVGSSSSKGKKHVKHGHFVALGEENR